MSSNHHQIHVCIQCVFVITHAHLNVYILFISSCNSNPTQNIMTDSVWLYLDKKTPWFRFGEHFGLLTQLLQIELFCIRNCSNVTSLNYLSKLKQLTTYFWFHTENQQECVKDLRLFNNQYTILIDTSNCIKNQSHSQKLHHVFQLEMTYRTVQVVQGDDETKPGCSTTDERILEIQLKAVFL